MFRRPLAFEISSPIGQLWIEIDSMTKCQVSEILTMAHWQFYCLCTNRKTQWYLLLFLYENEYYLDYRSTLIKVQICIYLCKLIATDSIDLGSNRLSATSIVRQSKLTSKTARLMWSMCSDPLECLAILFVRPIICPISEDQHSEPSDLGCPFLFRIGVVDRFCSVPVTIWLVQRWPNTGTQTDKTFNDIRWNILKVCNIMTCNIFSICF